MFNKGNRQPTKYIQIVLRKYYFEAGEKKSCLTNFLLVMFQLMLLDVTILHLKILSLNCCRWRS